MDASHDLTDIPIILFSEEPEHHPEQHCGSHPPDPAQQRQAQADDYFAEIRETYAAQPDVYVSLVRLCDDYADGE